MKYHGITLIVVLWGLSGCALCDSSPQATHHDWTVGHAVEEIGRLQDNRLVECSAIETSSHNANVLWAINDGGHGPYLYAMTSSGRSLGRIQIDGARNRDWEGMDTFVWNGRPMILVADFGDNQERHDRYTLYLIPEPEIDRSTPFGEMTQSPIGRIDFSYPDTSHDAEGVAVDVTKQMIYILTKRDDPPLIFAVPLAAQATAQPVVARKIAEMRHIPPPTGDDLRHMHGIFRSQPTAMDFSPDGRQAVVLTYKHAYLFEKGFETDWPTALRRVPDVVALPPPQSRGALPQRESICFTVAGDGLLVSSEGRGAAIVRVRIRSCPSRNVQFDRHR